MLVGIYEVRVRIEWSDILASLFFRLILYDPT